MSDHPSSLIGFQRRFPDDDACARYLAELRWPEGFVCPACAQRSAWQLRTKPWTYECRGCRRQTSLKAGSLMHGSKLSLTLWFWAAYLMATHSNGISALQLQRQLGLGSYKTAWLFCAKLRAAMRGPQRNPLTGLVEVDETTIHYRHRQAAAAGGFGRSPKGKLLIAGACEVKGKAPAACASPMSRTPRPPACKASSPPRSHQTVPRSPMAGRPTPACPTSSPTDPRSSGRVRPMRSCPGSTASFPTSRLGPSASITACATSTSRPTSTSSSSDSTADDRDPPPSDPSSAWQLVDSP